MPQKPGHGFYGDDYYDEAERTRLMAELLARWIQGQVRVGPRLDNRREDEED